MPTKMDLLVARLRETRNGKPESKVWTIGLNESEIITKIGEINNWKTEILNSNIEIKEVNYEYDIGKVVYKWKKLAVFTINPFVDCTVTIHERKMYEFKFAFNPDFESCLELITRIKHRPGSWSYGQIVLKPPKLYNTTTSYRCGNYPSYYAQRLKKISAGLTPKEHELFNLINTKYPNKFG